MFYTEVKIPTQPGLLTHGEEMWSVGSCFADEIGTRLQSELFQIEANPCGTLYNPASIASALQRIIDGAPYTAADIFGHNGQWHCMDFHSSFSGTGPDEVLDRINSTISRLHRALPRLRLLMVTFGSAHIFTDLATGRVAGNCHKLPAARFAESDLTCDEIVGSWLPLLGQLHAAAPQLRVMFTVSPIRHKAYGFHADRLSKATLLLAVDRICRESRATYFPAYEIMNDELRDYRFYAPDMIHPSQVACDHIHARLAQACFTPATATLAAECRKLTRRLQHRHEGAMSDEHTRFLADTEAMALELRCKHPELSAAMDRHRLHCHPQPTLTTLN